MNARTSPTTIQNETFQDIWNFLERHQAQSFTRRQICAALGRGKTSQMIRLIEAGVAMGIFYAMVDRVRGRDVFYYRINDFVCPELLEEE
jgi:response regulator of citrate/malate metabolism